MEYDVEYAACHLLVKTAITNQVKYLADARCEIIPRKLGIVKYCSFVAM